MNGSGQIAGTDEEAAVKTAVQSFYNQIGWQRFSDGLYQNATYEDLRPVSRKYIHDCHLRVLKHLNPSGKLLLDAGSGPIQYEEYLEYSRLYEYRVCADISVVALQEARNRIGTHGLFVVADIANLPFTSGCFDGVISLHTIHHLPDEEHVRAYREIYRMLAQDARAVIVDGWKHPPLMVIFRPLIKLRNWLAKMSRRIKNVEMVENDNPKPSDQPKIKPRGTFIKKYDAAQLKREVGTWMPLQIYCWRSVSVQFLRAFINPRFGGRWILDQLFRLEDRFPQFFGELGQYPLVVVRRGQQG